MAKPHPGVVAIMYAALSDLAANPDSSTTEAEHDWQTMMLTAREAIAQVDKMLAQPHELCGEKLQ